MKKIYLNLFLFLLAASAQAQPLQLSESRLREQTDRSHALLRADSTGYYILRFDKDNQYAEVEHYSTQLRYLNKIVCTDKARRYLGLVSLQQKQYLLYSRFRRNSQTGQFEEVSLYAKVIDPQTFKLQADSLEIIPPFKMESNFYQGNFAISPDKTKLLVYDYEEEGDVEGVRGLTNKVRLRVFDSQLKLIWEREVNLAPQGTVKRVMVIKKMRLSDQGEVAILTDFFRNADQRSYDLKKVTADPTLFFVGQEPQQFMRFTPNLGDLFFNELDFNYDSQGNIFWFGLYSKQKYYQQKGYFFIKINAQRSKILVKHRQDFPDSLVMQLRTKRRIQPDAEAMHYRLASWKITQDSGIVFGIERQPPGMNAKVHDLMIIRLNADGQIRWQHFIEKYADFPESQRSFLSHFLALENDQTYILCNQGIYTDNYAFALKIDPQGRLKRKRLFNYDGQVELLCPSLSYVLPQERLFLILQSRFFRNYSFGVLDLKTFFE